MTEAEELFAEQRPTLTLRERVEHRRQLDQRAGVRYPTDPVTVRRVALVVDGPTRPLRSFIPA